MLVLCLEWSRNPELSDDDDDMLSQARGTRLAAGSARVGTSFSKIYSLIELLFSGLNKHQTQTFTRSNTKYDI